MGEMMPQRQLGKYSPRPSVAQVGSNLVSLPLTMASIFDVRIVKPGGGGDD